MLPSASCSVIVFIVLQGYRENLKFGNLKWVRSSRRGVELKAAQPKATGRLLPATKWQIGKAEIGSVGEGVVAGIWSYAKNGPHSRVREGANRIWTWCFVLADKRGGKICGGSGICGVAIGSDLIAVCLSYRCATDYNFRANSRCLNGIDYGFHVRHCCCQKG